MNFLSTVFIAKKVLGSILRAHSWTLAEVPLPRILPIEIWSLKSSRIACVLSDKIHALASS